MVSKRGVRVVAGMLCAAIVLVVCWDYDFERVGIAATITFLINAVAIGWLFVRRLDSGPISLFTIHLIALWVMLVVAPMSAYVTEGYQFYDFFSITFTEYRFVLSNLLILVWALLVEAGYWFFNRDQKDAAVGRPPIFFKHSDAVLQLVVAVASLAVLASQVGVGVMTRQAYESVKDFQAASDFVIFQSGLRGVSYVSLAAIVAIALLRQGWASKRLWLLLAAVLASAILLINNPVAAARFITGVVAIAFGYLFWFRRARSALSFFIFTIFAVFLVFPVLDLGRRYEDLEGVFEAGSFSLSDALRSDTFRTYESIPAAIEYIDEQGSTLGKQLVGNLFFFITRDIWPTKPVGSGSMLATYFGSNFTNVACSLQCEGLVNFGYLGYPFAAVGMGWLFGLADRRYRTARMAFDAGFVTPYFVFYPFLLGFAFFVTRGDLLTPVSSSVMYAAGMAPMIVTAGWRRLIGQRTDSRPLVKPIPRARGR
jgi:hypothetical protein